MTPSPTTPCGLSARDVTITLPNGTKLLDRANLIAPASSLVILAGPSGCGKTTLLRWLANLPDDSPAAVTVEGKIEFTCDKQNAEPHSRGNVGLVFQNLALFDELSPEANVQFAIDHRRPHQPAHTNAKEQLKQLRIPLDTPLSRLSGGERQRVAVARTLATHPPILLFDEPTTGLDQATARSVAQLIADTQQRQQATVIVVTHDYAPFLPHNPKLYLLNPHERNIGMVQEEELRAFFQNPQPAALRNQLSNQPINAWPDKPWIKWLTGPGEVLGNLILWPLALLGGWRRPRWKLRYFWHYMWMVGLGSTAIYVAIAGAMLGFVFTSFSFSQMPYAQVTVPLVTQELLAAVGVSTFRIIVPLMIAVLLAGKCGAAIAADVGARRITQQFDALSSFDVEPRHYLYGNIGLALIIACPLLSLLAYVTNVYAAMIAYLLATGDGSLAVFDRNFFSIVWPINSNLPRGIGWVLTKGAIGGLVISTVAYTLGARPKSASVEVSRDVGLSIFWGSLGVLTLHSIFTFIEF